MIEISLQTVEILLVKGVDGWTTDGLPSNTNPWSLRPRRAKKLFYDYVKRKNSDQHAHNNQIFCRYTSHNVSTSLGTPFAYLHTKSLLKRGLLSKKRLPMGNFFPVRVNLSSDGNKINFDMDASLECLSTPLKLPVETSLITFP